MKSKLTYRCSIALRKRCLHKLWYITYTMKYYSAIKRSEFDSVLVRWLLFSCSILSDSLWPHGLQHTRLPCSSSSPRACSNSCPLSQWCHPTILPSVVLFCLQSFSPSVLCIRWPKYWKFSFSISSSNEYSALFSFKIDCFDLLGIQGTLKGLFQHHSLKASILWHSVFFMVQLSHPYMTTGKTIALTIWIFVSKVMSLLFNMLSRLVIAFLPRSKCLLISWLHSPSTVILEPKKIKSVTISSVSPSICHGVMRLDAMIMVFWMLNHKPAFSLSSFTFMKSSLIPLHFLS